MKHLSSLLLLCLSLVCCTACSPKYRIGKKLEAGMNNNPYLLGLVVFNPESNKEYINHNGSILFTPASNTKLVTFYAAYKTLGDSVPVLEYAKQGDSLIIRGTANPSTLYQSDSISLFEFFKNRGEELYLADATIEDHRYGTGWAWGDYQDYYQVEKNRFPLYGNIVSYQLKDDSLNVSPDYFYSKINRVDSLVKTRHSEQNIFFVQSDKNSSYTVPFKTSNELVAKLLSEELNRKVTLTPEGAFKYKTYYHGLYDSLYKQLLIPSDNFVAEQLLLQVGYKTTGKYSVPDAITFSLENYLSDLPQKPKWVDGSGLSRYNLFSPNDMIHVLSKMYSEIPFSKLKELLPAGGETGTIKGWYRKDQPYIYAKSGSLSNNHNLSGYLVTKKNNVLLFSFMNNHYMQPNSFIKTKMLEVFEFLYDHY
jgi:D-alanyl-D-alanine carboxypeptidase/D-alanyl-D-alanine-endopeptidase (penicillin-binding protein 4)